MGSAIAEITARRSVSVAMLSYCCTNNANRSRAASLPSTYPTFVHSSFQ